MQSSSGTPNQNQRAMESLKARAPEISKAFGPFFQSLMKDGALSAKQKELIAIGISVAVHCEPCIASHVEKCRKAGATGAEIMEAAGVGVVMGGGPAYTHAALAAATLQLLEQSDADRVTAG